MSNGIIAFQSVPLSSLRREDGLTFRLSQKAEAHAFQFPKPVLVYIDNSGVILLDDFGQLFGAGDIDVNVEVPAYTIAAPDLQRAFVMTLHAAMADSPKLTIMEKATALTVLLEYFKLSEQQVFADYWSIFELPKQQQVMEVLKVISGYSGQVKRFLHEHNFTLNDFYILNKLSAEQQHNLILFLSSFRLSFSNIRQLLEWIVELTCMENLMVSELINEQAIATIWSSDTLNDATKVTRIKDILYRRRYPKLYAYQRDMEQGVKEMKLPAGIQLIYPKDAERDAFSFRFDFASHAEFIQLFDKMNTETFSLNLKNLLDQYANFFD